MAQSRLPTREEMDDRYDRFVRLLEQEHWGEFVAVSAEGNVLLSDSLLQAVRDARDRLDPDSIVFKVGERAVGHIR
ncbi:MAG TPA: hypothetical protein VKV26_21090 [Dehalococcoidia bacterium]|nr:hypothetical protein [Dehalococcoidia bacterium]